jgi:diguanylate cyclase (GGDEF)-like protein
VPVTPEGPAQPLRLTWIAEDGSLFVFADARGKKQLELAPSDLIAHLESGRAVAVESLELPLTERTVAELLHELQHQAKHDPVTGLFNRRGFLDRVSHTQQAGSQAGQALCLIELDQFKVINSLCGMDAADAFLRDIAAVLAPELRRGELAGRLGDDRLAVWLSESDPAAARQRAQRLIEAIRCHRFKWQQHSFPLSANVGLAPAGAGFDPLTSLLQNADAACLRAREQGANQIQVYQADDSSLTAQSKLLDWAGRIDALFADGRLFPRCQRIAPVGDPNQASHFEILLGVRDEAGRFVAPSELVAAAERWHRIEEIDRWQVDAAIGWIERWPQRFTAIGGLSINLSGQSLCSGTFLQFLETRLSGTGWPREQITFEITETAAIEGFDQAEKFIRRIRRYGCRFSLDDFGSGYSSYAYLKNLKVDFLKIDGAFVRELTDNAADYAMVKSMNEIAHSLGMKTIAEYAESAAILAVLQEIGVDYAQGYHIGRPLPLDDLRP